MKPAVCFPVIIFTALLQFGCASLATPENRIKLATFNVRCPVDKSPNSWEERKERCRKVIQNNRLDIFGVQEAYIHQINDLIKDTDYSFIGAGRNDFKNSGEFSAIIYNRTRFKVLESGTFGLSEAPGVPGHKSWGTAYPRIATYGCFLDRISGKKFVYYNTHLDHKSSLARVNGVKLIIDHAVKNSGSLPLVISGDFNASPDSAVYEAVDLIMDDSASVSLTAHQGSQHTFNGFGKVKSGNPIDFIFVSKDFTVYSHKTDNTMINGMFPSDHFPVVAELTVSR